MMPVTDPATGRPIQGASGAREGAGRGVPAGGLVSVIMPCYNAGAYLRAAIESVLSQTYPSWELIVADDRSQDDSWRTIQEYAGVHDRVRGVRLDKHSGVPAAPRNRGLSEARGRYIAFLDADDVWHAQKLELQIDFMKRHGAGFCFTEVYHFSDPGKIPWFGSKRYDPAEIDHRRVSHSRLLKKNVIISGSSAVIERETLGPHRFNETPGYRAIEDYHLWLMLHQHRVAQSYQLLAPLVGYRVSATGISRSKWEMLRKNYVLYSEYEFAGHRLGWKKYYFLSTYIARSLNRIVKRSVNRLIREGL
jgi:glycosyltransferase involved in cell wall biosynthesis